MTGLLVLLVVPCAVWGLASSLRRRRTRYLMANRSDLIKESLERARSKQDGTAQDAGLDEPDPDGGPLSRGI